MKENIKIPHVTGVKQVLRAVKAGELKAIYLASDCDFLIRGNVQCAADQAGVLVLEGGTMRELGERAGVEVSAATVGILK